MVAVIDFMRDHERESGGGGKRESESERQGERVMQPRRSSELSPGILPAKPKLRRKGANCTCAAMCADALMSRPP
jgi:hypothetical protein